MKEGNKTADFKPTINHEGYQLSIRLPV